MVLRTRAIARFSPAVAAQEAGKFHVLSDSIAPRESQRSDFIEMFIGTGCVGGRVVRDW